ncbi:MAG: hypothetical protein JW983_07925 [Elusimicrobia bacterium]|nr:hypothetical protein [Elusimicrobiota bacterium]
MKNRWLVLLICGLILLGICGCEESTKLEKESNGDKVRVLEKEEEINESVDEEDSESEGEYDSESSGEEGKID